MRYLFILIVALSLASCSSADAERLKAENEALRSMAENCQLDAENALNQAREAEARALMAMQEAENQARLAEQALKDCEGK